MVTSFTKIVVVLSLAVLGLETWLGGWTFRRMAPREEAT